MTNISVKRKGPVPLEAFCLPVREWEVLLCSKGQENTHQESARNLKIAESTPLYSSKCDAPSALWQVPVTEPLKGRSGPGEGTEVGQLRAIWGRQAIKVRILQTGKGHDEISKLINNQEKVNKDLFNPNTRWRGR